MSSLRTLCNLVAVSLLSAGCGSHHQRIPESTFEHIAPDYSQVKLSPSADSIAFPLGEHVYNRIKSFNVFSHAGQAYIAFYDKRSMSVAVYHYATRQNICIIPVAELFTKSESRKISVYVKNFDSIFVATSRHLTLIDSSRKKLLVIDFLRQPKYAWAEIEVDAMPVVRDGHLFTSVAPFADDKSLSAIKKWRVVYDFDLSRQKADLLYNYPERYSTHLYGSVFLGQSICVNNKGHFVFSFTADSVVYETDLVKHHKSYLAKSRHQQGDIAPFTIADLKAPKQRLKNYLTRDTYSSIYFDPYKKRYLRIMRSKISEAAFDANERRKNNTIVILDEHFKIIGESEVPFGISVSEIFFSPDGDVYARANEGDEYAIHFVRLVYSDDKSRPGLLSQSK